MKVEVTQEALVVCTPAVNKVYQPGIHLAPRAHIEQIEAQGKGKRVEDPEGAAEASAAVAGESP
ncbi:hypothetical protein [Methylocystis parvus]|uniref:hypothetical protein n=1 Tax=Methylocystis parvus TaxID=134 RepID=UPI003C7655CD